MITDAAVFEDDYRPRQLLHRDAEQEQLARAFEPALQGDRAHDILVHGPQGVGKTVLVNHILERLDRHVGIKFVTVRCLGKTTAGIVRATLQELGIDKPVNTPQHDLCVHLREFVDEPTVVVLDEADDVPDTEALSRLWDVPDISVVVICHDHDRWLSRLDVPERRQWHTGVELGLERYAPADLADILGPRARKGLEPGTVGRDQLETIADRAAGNARTGIQTLHASARVATERRQRKILDEDIPEGYERALRWMREANLASLPFHHHVLYELVRAAGEIDGETLHEWYDQVADDIYTGRAQTPITKRARRYKLEKLEEYDLVGREGEYYVHDESVTSPLEIVFPVGSEI